MKTLIQFALIAFLVLSSVAVWKFGKWLRVKLNTEASLAGLLLYFLIHFLIIIVIVLLFKMLMIYLVKRFVAAS